MEPAQDDVQLIIQAQKGDRPAFGRLYERHLATIYQYIYYRVGRRQDAEDLTETVFLRAWQALPEYRPVGKPPLAWLYRIAHNLVVDHYRQKKPEMALPEQLHGAVTQPEHQLLRQEQSDVMAAAIGALAPQHQQVLVLRFVQGLSPPEVATIMERSHGAVRVLQHRALAALAVQLKARGIDHE